MKHVFTSVCYRSQFLNYHIKKQERLVLGNNGMQSYGILAIRHSAVTVDLLLFPAVHINDIHIGLMSTMYRFTAQLNYYT
jgi:hypothetical protein